MGRGKPGIKCKVGMDDRFTAVLGTRRGGKPKDEAARLAVERNFGDSSGDVRAHHHENPDGTEGGWVANTATVADTVTVEPGATVFGREKGLVSAKVADDERVY